jgi:hypothetical protein
MITIENIITAIKKKRVYWTTHSEAERFNDNLYCDDILSCILNGNIIEKYENDKPLHSCLIFGKSNDIFIHSVIGYNNKTGYIRIITVYIPDKEKWENDFITRKKK